MPRLSFENCVKISTESSIKDTVEDKEFFNVEFIVRNGQDKSAYFLCNKFTLAAASPVFNKQFFGSLKRKQEDENQGEMVEVINIEDIAKRTFQTFLQLLFLDTNAADHFLRLNCSFRLLFEVLQVADKYCVEDVKKLVIKGIDTKDITKGNIIKAVSLITVYQGLLPYESVCESLMNRCCKSVLILWPTTHDFLIFYKNHMAQLSLLLTKARKYLLPITSWLLVFLKVLYLVLHLYQLYRCWSTL